MPHAVVLALLLSQGLPSPSPQPALSPAPASSPVSSPVPGGLTVSPSALDLNPAQQRTIAVSGATGPLSATLDQKLVRVDVDPNGTDVTVTATQATGSDVLHLTDASGARADVALRVAFNAGTIVPQATLQVTGDPAAADWLGRLAQVSVARLTQALPGARVTVVVPPVRQPLAPGAQMQLAVPVEISSGGDRYFPQSGTTQLDVGNVALGPFAPALLFYDDDPEHVTQDGVLFRGTVAAGAPADLYYYHDNGGSDLRRIVVVLSTKAPDPASVQLIDSPAGPNADVMQVGHAVSRNYLLIEPRGEGTIVDVAQDGPFVLRDAPMTAGQGVAGNVGLRVLAGGPVAVTVLAVSPNVDPRALLEQPVLAGDGHGRTGAFALSGFGDDVLDYAAGGADAKLVIGDRDSTPPSAGPNAAGHDYGDYGVLHRITVNFSNPGSVPAAAYLYLRPIAGIDRASFLVDGSLIELGCVREPVPYRIAAFDLAPGQASRADILTMTDGGSFYPVEIGVTAAVPQSAAPPIGAPDGCFPKPATGAPPVPGPSPAPLRR